MDFMCHRKWTARWKKARRWWRWEARANIRLRHSRAEPAGITRTLLPETIFAVVSTRDNLDSFMSSRRATRATMIRKYSSQRTSGSRNLSACRTFARDRRRTMALKSCGAASINDKALGHGEPIRVKAGARVLFHLLNVSATDDVSFALAGHDFLVIALDGNPLPIPRVISVLTLAPAERIDAIVEMKQPGVWILGAVEDRVREMGMGVVVEYAGRHGAPQWSKHQSSSWDYTVFGINTAHREPDQHIHLAFEKIPGGHGGFNRW